MAKKPKTPAPTQTKAADTSELPDSVLDKVAGGGNVPVQSDYPGKEEFVNRGQQPGV